LVLLLLGSCKADQDVGQLYLGNCIVDVSPNPMPDGGMIHVAGFQSPENQTPSWATVYLVTLGTRTGVPGLRITKPDFSGGVALPDRTINKVEFRQNGDKLELWLNGAIVDGDWPASADYRKGFALGRNPLQGVRDKELVNLRFRKIKTSFGLMK